MALQQELPASQNIYESSKSLAEYLLMHFGTKDDLLLPEYDEIAPLSALDFPKRCAEECAAAVKDSPALQGKPIRALDCGCAVGRSTFEMARFFEDVWGLDFSQSFIDAANQLKAEGRRPYPIPVEGDITKPAVAVVDPTLDRSRTTFVQGDACNLQAAQLGGKFSVILAANLLCRLPKPRAFLAALPELLVPGGVLVMPSPYTWLEAYTKKGDWVGGYYDADGNPVRSFDELKRILGPHFDLVKEVNLPMLIHETARKNQWTVSHCTVWRLRG
eukprot:EG_transcript_17772